MDYNKYSNFKGGLVAGMALLMFGLVFQLDNLKLCDAALIWPLIPITTGVGLIIHYYLQKKDLNYKIGVYFGWIMLLLGITFFLNNFQIIDLIMLWPLIPFFIGVIFIVYYKRTSSL